MRREQAGQGDGENDAGTVGQHAGGGQGPRLQQTGPHRFDARPGLGVEEEFRAEVGTDPVRGERHGGRNGFDDDLGRGGARNLGIVHARAFAASSFHADPIDCGQDLALQQLAAVHADVDAVGGTHVDPGEGRGVDAARAEHPVEVDHVDHSGMRARHLAHQCVVGLHAGGRVLRPGLAVGLPVTGVDVGHGEQHHFGTKRVEDGDGRLQVGGQVGVPGRLADVHPAPVEEVVGDLPAPEAQGHDRGLLPGDRRRATGHASCRSPVWQDPPCPR